MYRRVREHFDRLVIVRAMQQAEGNQNRAADILGISRATLRARLRSMRLATKKVVTADVPVPPKQESPRPEAGGPPFHTG